MRSLLDKLVTTLHGFLDNNDLSRPQPFPMSTMSFALRQCFIRLGSSHLSRPQAYMDSIGMSFKTLTIS